MATIFEILRDLFLGRLGERKKRRQVIKKLKKIRAKPVKIKKIKVKLRKIRHTKIKHVKKHRKIRRKPTNFFKKLEELFEVQRRKLEEVKPKPVEEKRIKRKLRRRKIKRINVGELAEAFKLSTSTIQEIYNKLKEMETKIPETPTEEVNVNRLRSQVEEIEKTAATSGASLVPEILDLINYTKERVRELELGTIPPQNPITEAKDQIEELEREKKHLEESQKVIEEKYYKREIDESSFKKIIGDYEQRLVETDVKIKNWKKELTKLEREAELPEEREKIKFKIPQAVKLKDKKKGELKILGIKLPKILRPLTLPKSVPEIEEIQKGPPPKIPKEVIKEVIVANIMTKNVFVLKPNDTLNYVVRLFADKKISGAPVLKGNNLVGVVSESDIVKFIGGKELLASGVALRTLSEIKVQEVMHKNPLLASEYTKLSEAADLMNKNDVTRLPVLNDRRELVGIITRADIIRGISKELLFKILEGREIERITKVETDIDEILKIVERRGAIGLGEIQKRLTLPEDKIEEWGKILEKHNLIELFYPPIGKPEFRKKIE